MIKKLVLGLIVCCGAINAMEIHTNRVIKKSKSDSSLPVAVSMMEESAGAIRPNSTPVTTREIQHAIEITSMEQFSAMTKNQANKLKLITFREMEINEKFIDKFWELFSSGIEELRFEACRTVDNYSFSDLFDGDYPVRRLVIKSNDLTMDDVEGIFSLVYPHLIRQFIFDSSQLNTDIVKNLLMKRLGSCSPELEILNTAS